MITRYPAGRVVAALTPILALFMLWTLIFLDSGALQAGPSGTRLAGDFAIFVGAAQVLHESGDPYDQRVLYSTERTMLVRQHVAPPKPAAFIRVGNPPIVFWLLAPLTYASFRVAGWLWVILLYLLLLAAFLRLLAWSVARHRLPIAIAFLVLPQTVYAAYYGNLDALIFASLVGALSLIRRYPLAAGVALSLVWLKPQVGLPLAFLLLVFVCTAWRRSLLGFLAGSGALVIASAVVAGPRAVWDWFSALAGYSHHLGVQPDIASLSGLYAYRLTGPAATAMQLLLAALALAVTVWWGRQLKTRSGFGHGLVSLRHTAWLWPLWFLATPFAHFHDEVVLVLPLVVCLGLDESGDRLWAWLVALYSFVGSLLLFPLAISNSDFQSLGLIPMTLSLFWIARRGLNHDASAFAPPRRLGPEALKAAG